ncbi:BTAD domain-containing putative transcriptional regulator [Streptomyces sp. AHA2]|uniref:BTAD domain-containing putative transcriptional regulator n=1 Tax=Streptomyces sp. AHA2 TaxID=3064526 RepID=UPI002FDFCD4C
MRFGLLGPPALFDGTRGGRPGEARIVPSGKSRVLLAALLLDAGRVVSVESLKDALWGGAPPVSAHASLHNHVSRLRRVLDDPGRLRTVPSGYVLRIAEGELDVHVFDAHVAAARAAHMCHERERVVREVEAALALWRGAPLAGLPPEAGGYAVAHRLREARLLLLEWRYDAELALGGPRLDQLVPELAVLAEEYPLREVYHRQLMLALHRTGRRAEALAVHTELRNRLVDRLGIEPGPGVQAAHVEVLRGAADTGYRPAGPPTPSADTGSRPVAPSGLPADTGYGYAAPSGPPADTGYRPAASSGWPGTISHRPAGPPTPSADTGSRPVAPSGLPADTGYGSAAPSGLPADTGSRAVTPSGLPADTGSRLVTPLPPSAADTGSRLVTPLPPSAGGSEPAGMPSRSSTGTPPPRPGAPSSTGTPPPRPAAPSSTGSPSRRPGTSSLPFGHTPPPPAAPPPPTPSHSSPPPAQLPPPPVPFTGRRSVRNALCRTLTATGPRPTVVVSGMAGVGKSALALVVAHDLAKRFPDGQLHLDLHGATPGRTPLTPGQALTALLRDLGIEPCRVPECPDAASALLRSLLAPTRTLLVLDGAAGAAQVRPLLPGGAGCAVIVTSRSPLTSLDGAARFRLRPLSDEESADLLRLASGREELEGAPASRHLVAHTGRLPLALRVVAARLAARPALTPEGLAGQLADGKERLRLLEYDDLSVRRSLAVTYDALAASEHTADRDAALVLRRIGALDRPAYGAGHLAPLTGLDVRRTEAALDRLRDVALLEETAFGRYSPHDLVRDFAREPAG